MSRAHLTHVRTIHTALNNFALSPSGTALAYSIGEVFLDDGEPHQLSSDPFEYVRAATQTHVVTTNTQALQARSLDGSVVTLAPAADHVPVHVDLISGALTAVIGTTLHQWNIADWSERLRVDLAAETSQKSFLGCAASDRWLVVESKSRFFVLTPDGQLESAQPAGKRQRPQIVGDTIVSTWRGDTLVTSLSDGIELARLDGLDASEWCPAAQELRSVRGRIVEVRNADLELLGSFAPTDAADGPPSMVCFAGHAPVVAFREPSGREVNLYGW